MFITLIITIMVQTFYATTCSPPQGLLAYNGGSNQRSGGYSFDDIAADTSKAVTVFEKLVTDSFPNSRFPDEQAIIAKHRAYMMLHLNSDLRNRSNELQDFYSVADAGNIGRLFRTEQALGAGKWKEAENQLNSIVSENAIEENYKVFYTAYLHMKQGELNSVDTAELKRLVHGCAKRDGIVVYQSRALHRLIYRDFKTYFDDCPDIKKQAYKAMATDSLQSYTERIFNLYPNPNDGNMILEYSLKNNEAGKLIISDMTGRTIADYDLNNKDTALIINESKLINGVYFITMVVNGKSVETERLVIIK